MGQYVFEILYGLLTTAITCVAGYIGLKIKDIVDKRFNNDEMRKIAIDTARWVEQIYQDFDSSEKAAKFDEALSDALTQKGIPFTSLDIARLREAAVNQLNSTDWQFTVEEACSEEYDSDEELEFEEDTEDFLEGITFEESEE